MANFDQIGKTVRQVIGKTMQLQEFKKKFFWYWVTKLNMNIKNLPYSNGLGHFKNISALAALNLKAYVLLLWF